MTPPTSGMTSESFVTCNLQPRGLSSDTTRHLASLKTNHQCRETLTTIPESEARPLSGHGTDTSYVRRTHRSSRRRWILRSWGIDWQPCFNRGFTLDYSRRHWKDDTHLTWCALTPQAACSSGRRTWRSSYQPGLRSHGSNHDQRSRPSLRTLVIL